MTMLHRLRHQQRTARLHNTMLKCDPVLPRRRRQKPELNVLQEPPTLMAAQPVLPQPMRQLCSVSYNKHSRTPLLVLQPSTRRWGLGARLQPTSRYALL